MEPEEQQEFIKHLCDNIRDGIIKGLSENPKAVKDWDGYELRQIIEDKAKDANYRDMGRGKKRAYNNDMLVNNI